MRQFWHYLCHTPYVRLFSGFSISMMIVGVAMFGLLCGHELIVHDHSIILDCICGDPYIEERQVYIEQIGVVSLWRATWNTTDCRYNNETFIRQNLTVVYSPDSWYDCTTRQCAENMMNRCAEGQQHHVMYSPFHELAYLTKRYSSMFVPNLFLSWGMVGFGIIIFCTLVVRYWIHSCKTPQDAAYEAFMNDNRHSREAQERI